MFIGNIAQGIFAKTNFQALAESTNVILTVSTSVCKTASETQYDSDILFIDIRWGLYKTEWGNSSSINVKMSGECFPDLWQSHSLTCTLKSAPTQKPLGHKQNIQSFQPAKQKKKTTPLSFLNEKKKKSGQQAGCSWRTVWGVEQMISAGHTIPKQKKTTQKTT